MFFNIISLFKKRKGKNSRIPKTRKTSEQKNYTVKMTEETEEITEATETHYCRKCGAQLPPQALYCPRCGTSVKPTEWEEIQVSADNLVSRVKELIDEGNVRRIIVRSQAGDTLIEIPMTIGVIGAFLAPYLAALGAIAAIVTRCTIAVERRTE